MITTKDLMDRYNIKTRQGIIQFVKKHLDEINTTGKNMLRYRKVNGLLIRKLSAC